MSSKFFRTWIVTTVVAIVATGVLDLRPVSAWAQEKSQKSDAPTDAAALKVLLERVNKLESEVERLKQGGKAPAPPADQSVMSILDFAHLGVFNWGTSPTRYLVMHLILENKTQQSFTIARDQIVAEIDGEERKLKDLPAQLLNFSVQHGRVNQPISTMRPPKEWKLPAGGQLGMWLVYAELPLGSNVPKCKLTIKLGETTKEINVNDVQRSLLSMDIQRIGPRQCLALFTISGSINSFNAGAFVDELDKLVEQKIVRVVVRWSDGATPPEQQLMHWLQAAAIGNGNPNSNPAFPVIPSAIREFHLTEFPFGDDIHNRNSYPYALRPTTQPRVHKTAAESVGAALRTAYLALPRDELMQEIRMGNPLSRAAALAYGGGRLDTTQMPQIFEWSEDKDPEMQKAAIQALSHFGESQAIEKLVGYAQRNVEPLSSAAIESLAGSRFGSAHDALLVLLKNEPAASKKKIVQVLAKYPRPIWSDTLYDFVTNSSTGMDAESLKALVQVGHPQLVDVLERALTSADKPIRDQAYQELSKRSDGRSEALAINYALKQLESGPPDGTTTQLLSRTKEPRAIPLLLKLLDGGNDRVTSINLLMQMGDQTVADKLVTKYSSLNNNEKVQILQGLKLFRHAKFRELCGDALVTNDNQLVTTAANALMQDGNAEGEKLLITALERQKTAHLLNNIMTALANFGTASAREALVKVRDSGDTSKRNYAVQALQTLSQRSPGFQYIFQAVNHRQNNMEKEAMEAFDMAIQIDPMLPEAYLGRSQLFSKQEKFADARKDLEKVVKLDPTNPEAYMRRGQLLLKLEKFGDARRDLEKVIELKYEPLDGEFITSLALAKVADGQLLEGIKYLEDNRSKQLEESKQNQRQGTKGLFLYNSACTYARAMEQVDKQADLTDRDAIRQKYRKQALADLAESFKQGFNDYDWTAKDPDFKILREESEFKQILASQPKDKPAEKPAEDDE